MLRARMMIVQIGCKLMPRYRIGTNGAFKQALLHIARKIGP